jgi:MarR family transcriptional repressor of emrRAB
MKSITAHFLATYAQLVTDRVTARLEATLGNSGQAAAAIIHLGHAAGCSIMQLSEALSLSHPGTVRLVDKLENDGLIERAKGRDGREKRLSLTGKGIIMRNALLQQRQEAVMEVMSPLSDTEWDTMRELLARLLKSAGQDDLGRQRMCRLCDPGLCRFYHNLKSMPDTPAALPVAGACDLFRGS